MRFLLLTRNQILEVLKKKLTTIDLLIFFLNIKELKLKVNKVY